MSGVVVKDMGLLVDRGVGGQGIWISSLRDAGPLARAMWTADNASAAGSVAWGSANRAYLVSFVAGVNGPVNVAWWENGGTVDGNIDCGLYDKDGNLLASTGAVAQATVSVVQSAPLTVPYTLRAGLPYYLAISSSSASSQLWGIVAPAAVAVSCGFVQAASAHPLPASVTFATMALAHLYAFGLSYRTTGV